MWFAGCFRKCLIVTHVATAHRPCSNLVLLVATVQFHPFKRRIDVRHSIFSFCMAYAMFGYLHVPSQMMRSLRKFPRTRHGSCISLAHRDLAPEEQTSSEKQLLMPVSGKGGGRRHQRNTHGRRQFETVYSRAARSINVDPNHGPNMRSGAVSHHYFQFSLEQTARDCSCQRPSFR